MTLKNTTDKPVGFKFKTNAPTRYSVKPVVGVVAKDGDVEIMGALIVILFVYRSIRWRKSEGTSSKRLFFFIHLNS